MSEDAVAAKPSRRFHYRAELAHAALALALVGGIGLAGMNAEAAGGRGAPAWSARGNSASISDGQGTLTFTCTADPGRAGGAFDMVFRDPALIEHRDHVRLSFYMQPTGGTREKLSVRMNLTQPNEARYEAPLRDETGSLSPLLRDLSLGQSFGLTLQKYTGEDIQTGRIFSLRGSSKAIATMVKNCGRPYVAKPSRRHR